MLNNEDDTDKQIELAEELAMQINICGVDEDGVDLLTILDALACGGLALKEGIGVATAAYYRVLKPNADPKLIALAAQRLGQSVVQNDK